MCGFVGDCVYCVEGGGEWLVRWSVSYLFMFDGVIELENLLYLIVMFLCGCNVYWWGDPWLLIAFERDLKRWIELVCDLRTYVGVIVAVELLCDFVYVGVNVQLDFAPLVGGWSGTEFEFEHGVRLRLFNSCVDGFGIEVWVLIVGCVQLGETVVLG